MRWEFLSLSLSIFPTLTTTTRNFNEERVYFARVPIFRHLFNTLGILFLSYTADNVKWMSSAEKNVTVVVVVVNDKRASALSKLACKWRRMNRIKTRYINELLNQPSNLNLIFWHCFFSVSLKRFLVLYVSRCPARFLLSLLNMSSKHSILVSCLFSGVFPFVVIDIIHMKMEMKTVFWFSPSCCGILVLRLTKRFTRKMIWNCFVISMHRQHVSSI